MVAGRRRFSTTERASWALISRRAIRRLARAANVPIGQRVRVTSATPAPGGAVRVVVAGRMELHPQTYDHARADLVEYLRLLVATTLRHAESAGRRPHVVAAQDVRDAIRQL